jgi:hypothetical protein
VFPYHSSREALAQRIEDEWNEACAELAETEQIEIACTFYQATRHTMVSRNLKAGGAARRSVSRDRAPSPVVTRRFYDHFVRKTFSAGLRAGLGPKVEKQTGGELVPLTPRLHQTG